METRKTLVTITNNTVTIFNTVNKVANITYLTTIQNQRLQQISYYKKCKTHIIPMVYTPFFTIHLSKKTRKIIKYYVKCTEGVGHTDEPEEIDISFALKYVNKYLFIIRR